MRLAISGAQSTGKTTLLEALKKEALSGFEFIDEVTRTVLAQGYAINENGTDDTQKAIIDAHIANIKRDRAVFDRCMLDGVVYTHYLYNSGKVSKEVLDYAVKAFEDCIMQYDVIFYLEPEFDIADDAVRSTNVEFRNSILTLFDLYITKYKLKVIKLTGSVEDRVMQFMQFTKYFDRKVDLHIHLGYVPPAYSKKQSQPKTTSVNQVKDFITKNNITDAVILYEKYEMLEELIKELPDVNIIGLQYIFTRDQALDIGRPYFRGVKLHNRRNLDQYNYEHVGEILKQLPDNSIVLYHTQQVLEYLQRTEDQMHQIAYYAVKFPKIKHIVGHAGAYGAGTFRPSESSAGSKTYDMTLLYYMYGNMCFSSANEISILPNVLLETSSYTKEKLYRISKFGIGTDFNFNNGKSYNSALNACSKTSKISKLLIQKESIDFLDMDLTKINYHSNISSVY